MSAFLFIIFLLFLFIFCYSLANLLTTFSAAEKIIIWFLLISADIILTLEISSLFGVFNQPLFLIVFQVILTGVTIILNKRFKLGYPKLSKLQLTKIFQNLYSYIQKNRLLIVFALCISMVYLFLAVCSIHFPQNITDNLYNHLSRIGYWIQQGSLKHYSGFSIFGMVYPYNNSLLMSLPILFLKTDIFTGLVQFFAAIICSLSIYSISINLGFKQKGSAIAALIVLTYPIIIFESITGQNDLLLAAFIAASFAFLISFIKTSQKKSIFLSLLGMSLALGTSQFALIVLPGFCVLFIYGLVATRTFKIKNLFMSFTSFLVLLVFFGLYAYIQNLVIFGSPFGPKDFVENITQISKTGDIPAKIQINSSRLFGQFISCDGLPPNISDYCLNAKTKMLTPILAKDIESDRYLYTGATYDLARPNTYNAESAWFGPLSWILILPSMIYALIMSDKKHKLINLIVLLTPISYFLFMQFTKSGWDPYQGRYLITAIVLLQPFTAWIFGSQKWFGRILHGLICIMAVFILVYSTLNNVSLPLTSKKMFTNLERWGQEHNLLIQKITYKLKPLIMAEKDVWSKERLEVMTLGDTQFLGPAALVEEMVPLDGSLGIMADNRFLPDFIFRGSQVNRSLTRIFEEDKTKIDQGLEYVLLAPEYQQIMITGFDEISKIDGWVLLARSNN